MERVVDPTKWYCTWPCISLKNDRENKIGNDLKSQEKIQQDKLKDELRKASLNLWSPDVCVTCMKMLDGEAVQTNPFQEIFLAAKAIIKIDDETTIPKHSKTEENIKKDHSMVKDRNGYHKTNLTKVESVERGV